MVEEAGRGDGDGLHDFRQQLQRYRLGLLFTIASIVMLFVSFTTLFVARRGAGKFDPLTGDFQSDWIPVALPMKILLINTAVLIVSSLLVEKSQGGRRDWRPSWFRWAIFRAYARFARPRCCGCGRRRWRAAAFSTVSSSHGNSYICHGAFVNSGPASTFFFLLTGTHALHLAGGSGGAALCLPGGGAKALAGAALHHARCDGLVLALHGRHVGLCAAGAEADGLRPSERTVGRGCGGRTIIVRFGKRRIAAMG